MKQLALTHIAAPVGPERTRWPWFLGLEGDASWLRVTDLEKRRCQRSAPRQTKRSSTSSKERAQAVREGCHVESSLVNTVCAVIFSMPSGIKVIRLRSHTVFPSVAEGVARSHLCFHPSTSSGTGWAGGGSARRPMPADPPGY